MRRYLLPSAVIWGVLLISSPAVAQTRGGQFEGFGGMTFGNNTTSASTFGGGVAVPLGDHAQIIGEAGRLSDVKSPLLDAALGFTPVDARLTAWYAEGGIRLLGSRDSVVRPYGEVTAGMARLSPSIDVGGRFGPLAEAGLSLLSETEPLVGAGAGVLVQGGPVVLDLGYRYKKILTGSGLASAFTLGRDSLDVSHVRVGIGIRF